MPIKLSKHAIKFLKHLPPKQEYQLVRRITELAQNPIAPDVRKMSGFDCLRVDSGEYRIVYSMRDDSIFVWLVGKRNDDEVYRKLKRMLK
ncbi:MAG: addiction module toxin RelE [Candidatus Taylorbacteria bacterium RIFCSPHIGHO2_02_FULL_47_18]|uniref:Addiction module toxin RelE n=1 Tax=Candidatus Taylorbacteria bacterium RIFCSPLOWO2_01_FULL_48_100 TaxID=1802322 RepID=A0A1G2NES5_9BACT|nr:MAG: addiction module toxin RelE [Candidatus Taylorbacteria bacterium RIFCSPHIGHO2_01_FULL_48_38]OHA27526.1 MAG: addiction module toxin RelE [Candidatus Taylorbacteria bacterium RIFCSPHIGHO2_02_FULL_47_18]OHA34590.1 MAG: addiction module toxin RelE [Candidatus Taylorbacteria bacterium RIFCSPLOWO2_01_FULL_48_100]OHA40353.1 MAG: addiction module toxin RelE [Candidatus Taylorbacteria bacterium RIFCSPLOWO2_02_FULL_48_16]OHA45222.1 MAG: addiction module toxin RelE [Candidatus Taylorbacteria bacte